ncbi:ribokinase [Rhodobacterales bacterium HKCCE2091]|nr:ribokinase [Rhodobacterales bacterium HKCCE2091]
MSLLVVGALHWDVVVDAPRMPRIDETLRGSAVDYRFGGKGGNQAVAAARAGARVALAGRIGSDAPGRSMRDILVEEGIDVSGLRQGPGASGMSVAITVEGGSYGAVIVSGENLEIDAGAVAIPGGCRVVLMQNEVSPGLLPAMADKARDAGAELWLNAAPAEGIAPETLAATDLICVNRVEAADLSGLPEGTDPVQIASELAARAPRAKLVMTLGGEGVVYAAPGEVPRHVPARRVEVVSTHGAGDVFLGTLAAAWLATPDLTRAVDAAQAAAARHVSQSR